MVPDETLSTRSSQTEGSKRTHRKQFFRNLASFVLHETTPFTALHLVSLALRSSPTALTRSFSGVLKSMFKNLYSPPILNSFVAQGVGVTVAISKSKCPIIFSSLRGSLFLEFPIYFPCQQRSPFLLTLVYTSSISKIAVSVIYSS